MVEVCDGAGIRTGDGLLAEHAVSAIAAAAKVAAIPIRMNER